MPNRACLEEIRLVVERWHTAVVLGYMGEAELLVLLEPSC